MVINPALEPDKSLLSYVGFRKFYTKKKYIFKKEYLNHLSKIKQSKIKNKKTTILIQSIKDEYCLGHILETNTKGVNQFL